PSMTSGRSPQTAVNQSDRCPLWEPNSIRYGSPVTPNRSFRRKPNRLALRVYRENQVCSLSISTNGRRPAFRSANLVDYSLRVLREKADKRGVRVLAYCFMPDHVHLLIHNTGKSSLIDFIRDFKPMTGYRYMQRVGQRL
ncbi:MAG TPA: transposase, partial [Gemmatimonadaceae bacterium]|nr:transposase [Gemmatimonadaceae bacterium]